MEYQNVERSDWHWVEMNRAIELNRKPSLLNYCSQKRQRNAIVSTVNLLEIRNLCQLEVAIKFCCVSSYELDCRWCGCDQSFMCHCTWPVRWDSDGTSTVSLNEWFKQCVQKKSEPPKHFALTSANMPRTERNYACTRPEVFELLSPNFIRSHHTI